jgi:hypothetical protein
MCMRCYQPTVTSGDQYTTPLCAAPRDGRLARQSGWFCTGCRHWHPYPRPTTPPSAPPAGA